MVNSSIVMPWLDHKVIKFVKSKVLMTSFTQEFVDLLLWSKNWGRNCNGTFYESKFKIYSCSIVRLEQRIETSMSQGVKLGSTGETPVYQPFYLSFECSFT